VDAKGAICHTAPVDIPRPVMMHDFAITAKHAVFMDLPMTFSFGAILKGGGPFRYEPKLGARFGILPRKGKGTELRWFEAEACYVFHTFTAYDDGDEVVLLGCRSSDFPAQITPPNLMSDQELAKSARPYRWRFHLKTGKVQEGPIDETAADFPRINDSLMGRKVRYGYTMKLKMDTIYKYDFSKDSRTEHRLGAGRLGGEPLFVPRAGGRTEDDGWLACFVHDQRESRSELLLLDARDLSAAPVARVLLPGRVPFGFHAAWIDGANLRST
jgi:carotenoid cleavage dioxygenase